MKCADTTAITQEVFPPAWIQISILNLVARSRVTWDNRCSYLAPKAKQLVTTVKEPPQLAVNSYPGFLSSTNQRIYHNSKAAHAKELMEESICYLCNYWVYNTIPT